MDTIFQAFGLVFDFKVLGVMLLSALFGLFVGAIPGLTATMAAALLIPFTFFMEPVPAIAAIVTTVAMAIFAGDIPGALLRIPGTPASAAYCDEAYALTRKGKAETALGISLVCSAIGGIFGSLILAIDRTGAGGICHQVLVIRILLACLSGTVLRGCRLFRLHAQEFCLTTHRLVHRDHRHRHYCRASTLHVRQRGNDGRHQFHSCHDRHVRHLRSHAIHCLTQ